jgi:hypothetical protein
VKGLLCIAAIALAWLAACSQELGDTPAPAGAGSKGGGVWFREEARARGLVFDHMRHAQQRFWFPEIMGAGLAWLDYDNDGRMDLYAVQSGDLAPEGKPMPGDRLFRNLGEGRFEDVTEKAGLRESAYGMGVTAGDIDNDGDTDLYVTNVGANALYQNNGDGTFRDITEQAGVGDAGWGSSCGFFDGDNDGDLDLMVVNYVRWSSRLEIDCKSPYGERDYCAPNNYNAPSQCILYENKGGARFEAIQAQAGFGAAFGNGLGLALSDLDGDGDIDPYVSNDGMANQLWVNQGRMKFVDEALLRGAAVNRNGAPEASMGTVVGDFDWDGDSDIFITNLRGETNTLYENDGRGNMRDSSARTGMAQASLPFTGFGNVVADFDHDGVVDVFVGNGRVGFWKPYFSETDLYSEPKQLFRGIGKLKFEEVPQAGLGAQLLGNSRGVAAADFDDDGDIDIAVLENHGPLRLLVNVSEKRGNWIGWDLRNAHGAPALNARIVGEAGGAKLHGEVLVCSSYCSANDPRVHWGLGSKTRVEQLEVRWASGRRSTHGPFEAGRYHRIDEPR